MGSKSNAFETQFLNHIFANVAIADVGDAAGLSEIAEPAALVSDAIIKGLKQGDFHVFPDTMAKQIESAYQHFAENVVEANLMES